MSFKNIPNIKIEYRTLLDDVVEDFYIPCLSNSIIYKRAVGFFSSSVLLQLTKGLSSLAKRGGKMQLLISPKLSPQDYEAIEKGFKKIEEVATEKIICDFDEFIEFEQKKDRFGLLSYMISSGFLEIKVAVLEKHNDRAMYHEKLGIMIDEQDNMIAFSGSANETDTALNLNYESIDVYCSWKSQDSEDRCKAKELAFNRLWKGIEKGLVTLEFPQVIKEKIFKYEKKKDEVIDIDEKWLENYIIKKNKPIPKEPTIKNIKLFDYQEEAIDEWKKHSYRGIFDMATGTGKTFTGCGAISKLFEEKKKLFVVICCPYIHLVEQWCEEVKLFNIEPIKCYGGSGYSTNLKRAARKFKIRQTNFVCAIVANRTFQSDEFQEIIKMNLSNTLLVVDEAHNFGSFQLSKCLEVDYPYRLALSATLDRYGDKEGTQLLYDFFGEKCITYTLERAIREDKLTKYKYYPILVNLDLDELEEYNKLTKQIGKLMHGGKLSEGAKKLLIKRARLIAGAKNKINVLADLITNYKNLNNLLIYCGAVKYGEDDFDKCTEEKKQIEIIVEMLTKEFNMKVSKFTSDETADERKNITDAYKNELIQALVAIKCLDEGMNIPAIKTAFILASSTNPKEYIQRRGRVLRKFPGKEFAEIYDFITITRPLSEVEHLSPEIKKSESSLVNRELIRFDDFNNLSMNPAENNALRDMIMSAYNLDVITDGEDIL